MDRTTIKLKWLTLKVRLRSWLRGGFRHETSEPAKPGGGRIRKILYYLLLLLFLFTLPFIMLVRGAVILHEMMPLNAWLAILGGVLLTSVLVFIYLSFFYGWMTGRFGRSKSLRQRLLLALLIVLGYCLHGVVYLSEANVKSPELNQEFRQLHPILRLGISTLVFLDSDLLLTDASRLKEDYAQMGLESKRHSLHFIQKNGYAHAVDIRTVNQGLIRNMLIRLYFRLMGFNTLRHVGTADHLHVSLHSHDLPGRI